MLRNIFPDGPPGDQDSNADDPGAFFAEFLPASYSPSKQAKGQQQQQKQQAAAAANAAADAAQASAAEASAAAATAAARAKQQAQQADRQQLAAAAAAAAKKAAAAPPQPAAGARPQPAAAAATAEADAGSDGGDLIDLPSMSEIRAAFSTAWFGDDDDSEGNAAAAAAAARGAGAGGGGGGKQQRQQQDEEEEEESVFDRLLPSFGRGSALRRKRQKPKPLRLKLAEQVLGKEIMSAVQLVDDEILSSSDPLPNAAIKFVLKASKSMGQGWARKNAKRVFAGLGLFIAASCGAMHGAKVAAKWLAHRVPRYGERVTGPAVGFTTDVLLPTSFFGPYLATYVLVMLVCRQPKPPPAGDEKSADAEAAAADAAGDQPPKQQQLTQQRSLTRELQHLEFEMVAQQPLTTQQQQRRSGLLRRRCTMARATAKSKARRAVAAAGTAAAGGGDAAAGSQQPLQQQQPNMDADTEW